MLVLAISSKNNKLFFPTLICMTDASDVTSAPLAHVLHFSVLQIELNFYIVNITVANVWESVMTNQRL